MHFMLCGFYLDSAYHILAYSSVPAVKSIRSLFVTPVELPPSIANSCPVCYLKQDTGSMGSDFSLFFDSTFHNFTRQSSETETSNVYVEVVLAAKIPLTESK
jgi:hypothetical protein